MENKTTQNKEETNAQLLELAKEDSKNIRSVKKNTQFMAWTLILSIIIYALWYVLILGKTGFFRSY
jgi:hypothetical protein